MLSFRPDGVRPRGTEWRGSPERGDSHFNWGIFLTDENVGVTVVFDQEAGYAVHSYVRGQPATQMSGYVNALAIV